MAHEASRTTPTEIVETWKNPSENSACYNCSRRDKKEVSDPFFGYGSHDADVFLLAADPGGHSSIPDTDDDPDVWYNSKRYWKNYPGTDSEVEQFRSDGQYSYQSIDKLKSSVPDIRKFINELENRSLSVYYTNTAKCNHINSARNDEKGDNLDLPLPDDRSDVVPNRSQKNECGKKRCAEGHLLDEIRYINPKVIVSLADGSNHCEYIFDFFNLKQPQSKKVRNYVWDNVSQSASDPEDVIPAHRSTLIPQPIVPMYHFTMIGLSLGQFLNNVGTPLLDSPIAPSGGKKDWYNSLVADRVASLVNEG